jgi:hypothetical protein
VQEDFVELGEAMQSRRMLRRHASPRMIATPGGHGMNLLAAISAGVFAIMGALHLVYTLHDFGERPRYFRPVDRSLLPAMRQTRTAIAPTGRDYWSGILGFNLSHSIGVLLFALLIIVTAQYQIAWLKPVLIVLGGVFAAIAWRCWFRIPMLGSMIGTALMIAAWAL